MHSRRGWIVGLAAAALLFCAGTGQAKKKRPWVEHHSDKYGISMKVPRGTVFKGKEWKGGWGGIHANYWGVQLWGIAHLGKKHPPGVIETFGAVVTGIPFKQWKIIDKGEGKNGFEWYKAARAQKGKHVVFGLYGVGPRGSYLLVLRTTQKSLARDKEAYLRWYRSIKVK